MPRTTADLVRGVNTELDDSVDLAPFISVANSLVTEKCTASGYTDQRLTDIETWLAAHFSSLNDPRTTMDGVGALQSTFETNRTALGLDLTRYGQQAKILDTAGNLAALDNSLKKVTRTKVKLRWLGTP